MSNKEDVELKKFATPLEAENLAIKHIENYINECNCQSLDDAKVASKIMLVAAMSTLENMADGNFKKVRHN